MEIGINPLVQESWLKELENKKHILLSIHNSIRCFAEEVYNYCFWALNFNFPRVTMVDVIHFCFCKVTKASSEYSISDFVEWKKCSCD